MSRRGAPAFGRLAAKFEPGPLWPAGGLFARLIHDFMKRFYDWASVPAFVALALTSLVQAQTNLPQRGPFWSGTVMRAKGEPAAAKGLAITVGSEHRSFMLYDLDTMRVATAWSGEFMEFGNTLTKIEWPPPPTVKGTIAFSTLRGPGWADAQGHFVDPRPQGQGPLPKSWAHYEGLYVYDEKVVLKYSVGGVNLLEMPGVAATPGQTIFTRTIQFQQGSKSTALVLASGVVPGAHFKGMVGGRKSGSIAIPMADGRSLFVAVTGLRRPAQISSTEDGLVILTLTHVGANDPFVVAISSAGTGGGPVEIPVLKPTDLRKLIKGGRSHWGEPIETQGRKGSDDGPYVVDTLTEPFPNRFNVSTFFGGFDFLPDGRAAICTFHGDVWLVSGMDDPALKLRWKRYATGLFQPLGLKVVKGEIYVAGRDQITRLKDLNGDGEADLYENFNNDTVVTPNYHEFVLDLHTDSKGNFYYAKGAPWEPQVTSPHQGTILKVTPDGKKMEIFATGLRAPNGMTVGPDDTVLVGDNQGHWMPSSKLNLVKSGAFMGMVPAAHRTLTLRYPDGREIKVDPSDPEARQQYQLKGWDAAMPIPSQYDEPICWIPMRWDNSSGGQVYVTSDKWGPWKGAPLFMSYGKCLLYGVLMDQVEGVTQAAMVPFGLKFNSGIMRGRFNSRDGQLYLCGLKGWQNSATRDGGFYRVRYTGKPVSMVTRAHAAQNGFNLTFGTALDAKAAEDPQNYAVELWNYRYSGAYGSPEMSVKNPGKTTHDKLEVKGAHLGKDGKTVFLEVEGLQPADQFSVKYSLKASSGTEMNSEVIGTIHKLGQMVN